MKLLVVSMPNYESLTVETLIDSCVSAVFGRYAIY